MVRVLAIDDSKSVHAFLRSLLGDYTHQVTLSHHTDGNQAIQELSAGKVFDLIFLDWEMPHIDGPTTFKKLREAGVTTPVIMMTSKNSPEDIQHMLSQGVAEYMMKPFTLDILSEKMEMVLGRGLSRAA